ncbi:hypothetical protein FGSG_12580 [Fusarium graminearum PH-1]|uniref:hypothetical protein n=1 Tax=Gibberella zeae (strain ATCC MYA-4620 / CBS 123657 / FGSC 9075 / NRRL 31084 / PH-1) TaxID=229533 RepID=UPI00021F1720|nr:hypothetical protein FGSG_12580 [Fusarium graminearum PH-1]ESU10542.1 hypothetical protein FGSG_12580 [Fusarium graminearum PH-1]|eukprot:XP_011323041.1 hypothetical protein FGSG_12580 [Fusarium graminearum PH-1]
MDHDYKDTMMDCYPRIVGLFQDALHAYLEQASRALFQALALLRTDGVLVQGDMTPVQAARIEPCDEANPGAVQTVEDLGFAIVYQVLHCDHDVQVFLGFVGGGLFPTYNVGVVVQTTHRLLALFVLCGVERHRKGHTFSPDREQ